ncbi:hypothetical protein ACFC26_21950 [Kitasatospora purpeofusca]|uniref:hypothetical protein n=1 Tax=Kitasatospora purpeofusca TaxID=67352 RepID=UPI0035D95919
MHSSDREHDPAVPDHCTGCGSTDPEDTGYAPDFDGYSACCNEPVCTGPLPATFAVGTPRRYPAVPCCDTDPRYCPALKKALDDEGVQHHGLQAARDGAPTFELFLGQDLAPKELRRALAALRRADWRCRPERIDEFNLLTVVRVDVGPPQRAPKKPPVLAELDQALQLAGFSPYRHGQAEAFWGYLSSLLFNDESASPYVGVHGAEGIASTQATREAEAAHQALREAGWTIQPVLAHSFYASAPVRPAS